MQNLTLVLVGFFFNFGFYKFNLTGYLYSCVLVYLLQSRGAVMEGFDSLLLHIHSI